MIIKDGVVCIGVVVEHVETLMLPAVEVFISSAKSSLQISCGTSSIKLVPDLQNGSKECDLKQNVCPRSTQYNTDWIATRNVRRKDDVDSRTVCDVRA